MKFLRGRCAPDLVDGAFPSLSKEADPVPQCEIL